MTDSVSFYDAFQRQMAIGSNEQRQRPRLGNVEGGIEFSGQGERMASDDAYGQSDARSLRVGSGKNSLMGSHGGAYFNNTQGTRPEREDAMWRDFQKHFNNKQRRMTPQNHHDFLDAIKNQRDSLD